MCIDKIIGNGYCFLQSVQHCLKKQHGRKMSLQILKQCILTELMSRHSYYENFLTIGDPDSMLIEAQNYLSRARYATDIVDVIIPATANAITIKMHIYERNPQGFLTFQLYEPDSATELQCPEVHLLYTATHRKGSNGADGHYDAIVPLDAEDDDEYYDEEDIPEPVSITTPNVSRVTSQSTSSSSQSSSQSSSSSSKSTSSSSASSQASSSGGWYDIPNETQFSEDDSDCDSDYGRACIDMERFAGMEASLVKHIPWDIDGDNIYLITYKRGTNWHKLVRDGRNFRMHNSNKISPAGLIRRIARCKGGWVCMRDDCPYYLSGRGRNTIKFERSLIHGEKDCFSCGYTAKHIRCKAQKLVECQTSIGLITVHHQDKHSCTPKVNRREHDDFMRQQITRYPNVKPKKLCQTVIESHLQVGQMEEAKEAALKLVNTRRISQLRHEERLDRGEVGTEHSQHSFVAVANFKKKMDRMDKYYVHKVFYGVNDDDTCLIFKSGYTAAQIMLEMNRDTPGNSALKQEYFFFDTMHDRVKGFKTMTGWVRNPITRSVQRLATMDTYREDTAAVIEFYENINQILQEVSGDPNYKFNPYGFMMDEACANFAAIEEVFGEEAVKRCVTCQWHFLKCARKAAADRVPKEERKTFTRLCRRVIESKTMHDYLENIKAFDPLRQRCKEVDDWMKFWDCRKYHIVDLFRGINVPGLNLAETGQSGLREAEDVRLIDLAYSDTSSMMLQDAQYIRMDSATRGKGPNLKQRNEIDLLWQKQRADSYGNQLLCHIHPNDLVTEEEHYGGRGFMPAATGSFKAPKPGNANPSQARKQATTTNKTKGKGRGRKCKMQEQEQDESIPSRGRGRGRKRKNPEPLEQDESIASLPLVPPSIEAVSYTHLTLPTIYSV